jgi:hypothetical protein
MKLKHDDLGHGCLQLELNERRIVEQHTEEKAELVAAYERRLEEDTRSHEQDRADLVEQHQQEKMHLVDTYETRMAEEALARDLEAQASKEVHDEAAVR